jgi:hypothetical protein
MTEAEFIYLNSLYESQAEHKELAKIWKSLGDPRDAFVTSFEQLFGTSQEFDRARFHMQKWHLDIAVTEYASWLNKISEYDKKGV